MIGIYASTSRQMLTVRAGEPEPCAGGHGRCSRGSKDFRPGLAHGQPAGERAHHPRSAARTSGTRPTRRTRRSSWPPTATSTWPRALQAVSRRAGAAHAARGRRQRAPQVRRAESRSGGRTVLRAAAPRHDRAADAAGPDQAARRSSRTTPSAAPTPDPAGFPNGRRPNDDVTDIVVRVAGGANYIQNFVGDGVGVNEKGITPDFPFLPSPYDGRNRRHAIRESLRDDPSTSPPAARRSLSCARRLPAPPPGLVRGEGQSSASPTSRRWSTRPRAPCGRRARPATRPGTATRAPRSIGRSRIDPTDFGALRTEAWVLLGQHEFRRGAQRSPSRRWRASRDDWMSWANLTDALGRAGRLRSRRRGGRSARGAAPRRRCLHPRRRPAGPPRRSRDARSPRSRWRSTPPSTRSPRRSHGRWSISATSTSRSATPTRRAPPTSARSHVVRRLPSRARRSGAGARRAGPHRRGDRARRRARPSACRRRRSTGSWPTSTPPPASGRKRTRRSERCG